MCDDGLKDGIKLLTLSDGNVDDLSNFFFKKTVRRINDDGVFESSVPIHRLVAEAFCYNPDIIHKTQVHHKNCDSLDNRADNLEWLTPEEHHEKHRHRQKRAKRKGSDEE